MIEVTEQINAVRREVGGRVLPAGTARVVTVAQTYRTTVADLWEACTSADRIARWFLPVDGDLRLHGRYQLEGNAGGRIERCDPPAGFAATWEYGGDTSWIEVRLTEDPAGARFTLEHLAHVDDDRWAEFGPGAVGVGWDLGLRGLAEHLASGASVGGDDAGAAWLASEEGRRFVTLSSERWRDAAVADGEDVGAARAAADRTAAAYTA